MRYRINEHVLILSNPNPGPKVDVSAGLHSAIFRCSKRVQSLDCFVTRPYHYRLLQRFPKINLPLSKPLFLNLSQTWQTQCQSYIAHLQTSTYNQNIPTNMQNPSHLATVKKLGLPHCTWSPSLSESFLDVDATAAKLNANHIRPYLAYIHGYQIL